MKNNVTLGNLNPTASLAIKKSRLKIYNKKSNTPTYYLRKGQEFQIELFNPTTDKVMAKIKLNGNFISQKGLVMKPGERVFLDRYFDIDRKFMFDTYEVSNTEEVKQAIRDNGDIEILFYREQKNYNPISFNGVWGGPTYTYFNDISTGGYVRGTTTNNIQFDANVTSRSFDANVTNTGFDGEIAMASMSNDTLDILPDNEISSRKLKSKRIRGSKKIETGRVETGSKSNQEFEMVNLDFESFAFHTVSYKLLPESQKNVNKEDLYRTYCTNCGAKAKAKDNFCSKCGNKL